MSYDDWKTRSDDFGDEAEFCVVHGTTEMYHKKGAAIASCAACETAHLDSAPIVAEDTDLVTEVSTMSPKQYKAIIEQLGLSQERAGEWLGVSPRTGQNYAAKGPPEPVAKLLRLCVRLKLEPEDVK